MNTIILSDIFKKLLFIFTLFAFHILLGIFPNIAAAIIYFDLTIDESRQLLYGSDRYGGKIDVIAMNTLKLVDSLEIGSEPVGLDISPDGSELAVALYGQSEIAFVDLSTLEVIKRLVPLGTTGPNQPYDVLYGRPGRLYSVGSPGSYGFDYVHSIDTVNKVEVGRSVNVMRNGPRLAITGDNNTLYVSSSLNVVPQNIYRFDVSTDTPIITSQTPHGPAYVNTMAVKPDGSLLYSSRGQVWSGDLTTLISNFVFFGYEIEYSDTLQKFFITNNTQINEYDANTYVSLRQLNILRKGGVARVNAAGTTLYVSTESGVASVDLLSGKVTTPYFPWPMFLAAITANTEDSCESNSYWGVYSLVCCPYSPLTFSATISGVTKRSIVQSCSVEPTWEGWARESEGTKTVIGQILSSCSSGGEIYQLVVEKGKSYMFLLEIVNNYIVVNLYVLKTCDLDQSDSVFKRQFFPGDTHILADSAEKINEFRLDLTPEVFKSMLNSNK